MTDMESELSVAYESDKAIQKIVDALNEIGCTSFMFTQEEYKKLIGDNNK